MCLLQLPLCVRDEALARRMIILPKRPDLIRLIPLIIDCISNEIDLPPFMYRQSIDYHENTKGVIEYINSQPDCESILRTCLKLCLVSGLSRFLRCGHSTTHAPSHVGTSSRTSCKPVCEFSAKLCGLQRSGMSTNEIIGQFVLQLQPDTSVLQRLRAALGHGARDSKKREANESVVRFGQYGGETEMNIKYFNAGLRRLCLPFREFQMDEVSQLFVAFDTDNSGSISKEELRDYIGMCETHAPNIDAKTATNAAEFEQRLAAIKSSAKSHAADEERELDEATANVKALHDRRSSIFQNWGIMYCGGSAPIIKDLRTVSKQYGINLALESFSW